MKEEIGEWKLGIECNECGHLALAPSKVPRVCPKCGALGAGVVEVPVRFRYNNAPRMATCGRLLREKAGQWLT